MPTNYDAASQTLTGGEWFLDADSNISLAGGTAPISILDAEVSLEGANNVFSNLDALSEIDGNVIQNGIFAGLDLDDASFTIQGNLATIGDSGFIALQFGSTLTVNGDFSLGPNTVYEDDATGPSDADAGQIIVDGRGGPRGHSPLLPCRRGAYSTPAPSDEFHPFIFHARNAGATGLNLKPTGDFEAVDEGSDPAC